MRSTKRQILILSRTPERKSGGRCDSSTSGIILLFVSATAPFDAVITLRSCYCPPGFEFFSLGLDTPRKVVESWDGQSGPFSRTFISLFSLILMVNIFTFAASIVSAVSFDPPKPASAKTHKGWGWTVRISDLLATPIRLFLFSYVSHPMSSLILVIDVLCRYRYPP